ncbi:hypothetical protein Bhyg_17698, partial [Pseudolycoriella hygida]
MEDIKEFLKSCGLTDAIPSFERNKITVDLLKEMSSEDMKEVLPALGDRLRLKKAINGLTLHARPTTKSQRKREINLAPTKINMKNDPKKKAFVLQMLKNGLACRPITQDWTLVDFSDGSLNCLLCKKKIQLQTRPGGGLLWNTGNYKRHVQEHKNNKSGDLGNSVSSFLEVVLTEVNG